MILKPIKILNFIFALFLLTSVASKASAKSFRQDSENYLGVTNLMTAVIDGDVEAVKFFSKVGNDKINKVNIAGSTALNLASRSGDNEIIAILIKSGADVNTPDNEGWTPLMKAARSGNHVAVDMLLAKKANIQNLTLLNESALVKAAASKCLKCFSSMVEAVKSDGGNAQFIKDEFSKSFLIAKNHEDEKIQNLISSTNDEMRQAIVQKNAAKIKAFKLIADKKKAAEKIKADKEAQVFAEKMKGSKAIPDGRNIKRAFRVAREKRRSFARSIEKEVSKETAPLVKAQIEEPLRDKDDSGWWSDIKGFFTFSKSKEKAPLVKENTAPYQQAVTLPKTRFVRSVNKDIAREVIVVDEASKKAFSFKSGKEGVTAKSKLQKRMIFKSKVKRAKKARKERLQKSRTGKEKKFKILNVKEAPIKRVVKIQKKEVPKVKLPVVKAEVKKMLVKKVPQVIKPKAVVQPVKLTVIKDIPKPVVIKKVPKSEALPEIIQPAFIKAAAKPTAAEVKKETAAQEANIIKELKKSDIPSTTLIRMEVKKTPEKDVAKSTYKSKPRFVIGGYSN
jgi:hypothetical protein